MDWKSFTSSIVSSLAWPSVAMLFILLVRRQIVPLVQRLEELALPGGAKAKFYKDLKELKEKIEELPAPIVPQLPSPTLSDDDKFLEFASKYPSAAILEAYKPIERVINEYKSKYPNSKMRSEREFIKRLQEVRGFGSEMGALFETVRRLRYRAVHSTDLELSTGTALEYRDLCLRLASQIESAIALLEEKSLIAMTGYAGDQQ